MALYDFGATTYDSKGKEMGVLIPILRDAGRRALFLNFCAEEFTLCNPIAMLSLYQYRGSPSLAKAKAYADAFLNGARSPLEINVAGSQTDTVRALLKKFELGQLWVYNPDAYQKTYKDLLDCIIAPLNTNLGDTYSRYMFKSHGKAKTGLFGLNTTKLVGDVGSSNAKAWLNGQVGKKSLTSKMEDQEKQSLKDLERAGYDVREMLCGLY